MAISIATTKNGVYGVANPIAGRVEDAENELDTVRAVLISAQAAVNGAWDSESGKAMASALDSLRFEMVKVSAQMEALQGMIKARAGSIYANWPEEEAEE